MRKFPPLAIDALVLGLFCLPLIGVVAAIWTGNLLWLLLLFVLAIFL